MSAGFSSQTYEPNDFYAGGGIETKDYAFPAGLVLKEGRVVSLNGAGTEIVADESKVVGVMAHDLDTTSGPTRASILVDARLIKSKVHITGEAVVPVAVDNALRNIGITLVEAG
ncbi:MAG: hypothetical protein ACRBHB_18090 [Arenicella sp.]